MNSHQIKTSAHGHASYVKQRPTAEGCSYLYAAGGLRHSCINNEPNLLNLLKLNIHWHSSTGNLKKRNQPFTDTEREQGVFDLFTWLWCGRYYLMLILYYCIAHGKAVIFKWRVVAGINLSYLILHALQCNYYNGHTVIPKLKQYIVHPNKKDWGNLRDTSKTPVYFTLLHFTLFVKEKWNKISYKLQCLYLSCYTAFTIVGSS